MPTLLSLGHGYSAKALGRLLLARGWRVIGTGRSDESLAAIGAAGAEAARWPGTDLAPLLGQATHLLTSVAPDGEGDPVLREAGAAIAAAAPRLEWAGYLSTTGVYGDRQGGWVDEDSELRPATARGRARVAAEAAWRAVPGLPLHVFRLAGIYGPGRGPFEKVRSGTARRIVKPGQVFSRIHVEDIARALAASIDRPDPGATYNLCDDDPAPPEEVIAEAARLLGLPPPPEEDFATAAMTPMARSFYAESKRVRNDRAKRALGLRLRHPSYREGLAALLAAEAPGTARVGAVCLSPSHGFSKAPMPAIRLLAGLGVEGDAHAGATVRHRSRVARDPTAPNLRQVHLIPGELLEELAAQGFALGPGDLGENVLTLGLDLLALPEGTRLAFGSGAALRVTGLRNPCAQIDAFRPGLLARVLGRDAAGGILRRAGVMAVVEAGGPLRPGDAIAVEPPPPPHRPLAPV